jgi:threonyl-tRNA synthetase
MLILMRVISVVGSDELEQRSVNVRNRDDVGAKERRTETIPLDVITEKLVALKTSKRLENKL